VMLNSTPLFLREQPLNFLSHDSVAVGATAVQLTIPAIAYNTMLVDQVDAGPIAIAPRVPDLGSVVYRNREGEPMFLDFAPDILDLRLVRRFGCMHADYNKAFCAKIMLPTPVPGVVMLAIDSAKCPEMHSYHVPTQLAHAERLAVDPGCGAG